MKKRRRQKQESMFIATNTLAKSPGHPFYEKLNQVLAAEGFDAIAEAKCAPYYAVHRPRVYLDTPVTDSWSGRRVQDEQAEKGAIG